MKNRNAMAIDIMIPQNTYRLLPTSIFYVFCKIRIISLRCLFWTVYSIACYDKINTIPKLDFGKL